MEAIVDPMLPPSGHCDSLTLVQVETASTRCHHRSLTHRKLLLSYDITRGKIQHIYVFMYILYFIYIYVYIIICKLA